MISHPKSFDDLMKLAAVTEAITDFDAHTFRAGEWAVVGTWCMMLAYRGPAAGHIKELYPESGLAGGWLAMSRPRQPLVCSIDELPKPKRAARICRNVIQARLLRCAIELAPVRSCIVHGTRVANTRGEGTGIRLLSENYQALIMACSMDPDVVWKPRIAA